MSEPKGTSSHPGKCLIVLASTVIRKRRGATGTRLTVCDAPLLPSFVDRLVNQLDHGLGEVDVPSAQNRDHILGQGHRH